MKKYKYIGLVSCLLALAVGAASAEETPWRLQQALSLPEWFQLSGSARVRYESLDGQFRTAAEGSDQQLAFRTLLQASATFEHWRLVAELEDSRQELSDDGSSVKSSMVNTTELLQAYFQFKAEDFLVEGSDTEIRLGRQTMDVGSRRLAARNRFRNTLNVFDGASMYWKTDTVDLQAFYFMPVVRRPSDSASLLDNEQQMDRSYHDFQFWGLHSTWKNLFESKTVFEAYLLVLDESDDGDLSTKDRQLYTPGLRLYRQPVKGAFDYDLELVAQLGEQHGSTSSADSTDLDHWAQFVHLEAGYTQDMVWSPRVALLFDYASGDDDPNDEESNRFDTLYGARRFEHGPTGIYGSFARSNIVSPGISLKAKPHPKLQTQFAYRAYWLASDTDAWTTSGLRDASGDTDSFVGQQVEARLKWEILPGNLSADIGYAHLFAGSFIKEAPGSTEGDSDYAYASLTFKF
ncbi:alginate export family protein [Coraliomargarita sp. W4R72]